MLFAALHESAHGPIATYCDVARSWSLSGSKRTSGRRLSSMTWSKMTRSGTSQNRGATFQRSPPDPAPEFGYCGKIESSQTRGMVSALSELQSRHS